MNEKEARPPWAEWHESLPTELRAQPLDDVWRVIDDCRKCFPGAFPPGTPFPPYLAETVLRSPEAARSILGVSSPSRGKLEL
jgi:hypothetical protein